MADAELLERKARVIFDDLKEAFLFGRAFADALNWACAELIQPAIFPQISHDQSWQASLLARVLLTR